MCAVGHTPSGIAGSRVFSFLSFFDVDHCLKVFIELLQYRFRFFFLIYLFIFGCVGSLLLRAGFL